MRVASGELCPLTAPEPPGKTAFHELDGALCPSKLRPRLCKKVHNMKN